MILYNGIPFVYLKNISDTGTFIIQHEMGPKIKL
jgi:hypothetical protein